MQTLVQSKPCLRPLPAVAQKEFRLTLATAEDRQQIYRLRHDTYACEPGQHAANDAGMLSDKLDAYNLYLVAWQDEAIAGFISITPLGRGSYSVEN